MRVAWLILWVCLPGFASPAPSASTGSAAPSIHLVRVNDPSGVDGFDLTCPEAPASEEEEPLCELSTVRESRQRHQRYVSYRRAVALVSEFLGRVEREWVKPENKAPPLNPPVGDVLLLWKVRMGGNVSQGVVRRARNKPGVDPRTLKAVLMLEGGLAREAGHLP